MGKYTVLNHKNPGVFFGATAMDWRLVLSFPERAPGHPFIAAVVILLNSAGSESEVVRQAAEQ
jgi:hypothetical protein